MRKMYNQACDFHLQLPTPEKTERLSWFRSIAKLVRGECCRAVVAMLSRRNDGPSSQCLIVRYCNKTVILLTVGAMVEGILISVNAVVL